MTRGTPPEGGLLRAVGDGFCHFRHADMRMPSGELQTGLRREDEQSVGPPLKKEKRTDDCNT